MNRRKGEELSSSDCPSEPASRCPEPAHLFGDGPAALGTTDELAAESSQQLGSTEGGLAHAEVVARCTSTQQQSRPHKPSAKGSDHTEPAASSEVATGHMSVGDMSRSLCGMPEGTTLSPQVATNNAAPAGKQQNETSYHVSGFMDTRGFFSWIQASCQWAFSPD